MPEAESCCPRTHEGGLLLALIGGPGSRVTTGGSDTHEAPNDTLITTCSDIVTVIYSLTASSSRVALAVTRWNRYDYTPKVAHLLPQQEYAPDMSWSLQAPGGIQDDQ